MDCPAEVTAIINVLRQQKDVDVSTERLINSVLDLQANRWGRNEAACKCCWLDGTVLWFRAWLTYVCVVVFAGSFSVSVERTH